MGAGNAGDGREIQMDAVLTRPDVLSILIEGKSYEIKCERSGTDVHLWVGPDRYAADVGTRAPCAPAGQKALATRARKS